MTLSMNMAVIGKYDIIIRINIVVTMENTMILRLSPGKCSIPPFSLF